MKVFICLRWTHFLKVYLYGFHKINVLYVYLYVFHKLFVCMYTPSCAVSQVHSHVMCFIQFVHYMLCKHFNALCVQLAPKVCACSIVYNMTQPKPSCTWRWDVSLWLVRCIMCLVWYFNFTTTVYGGMNMINGSICFFVQ